MRDKNHGFIQFESSVSTHLGKELSRLEIKVLRNHVVDSPTFLSDYSLKYPGKKLIPLRGLALISYYVPENLGWYIRSDLLEILKSFNLKDQLKLKLLLVGKEEALGYFFETREFSKHDFFGNILREGLDYLKRTKIIPNDTRVKWPSRKRGYHDHGSRTLDHQWVESYLGYVGTEIQEEIDHNRYLHKRTYRYLKEYLSKKYSLQDGSRTCKVISRE